MDLSIILAMQRCAYKAWLLNKEQTLTTEPGSVLKIGTTLSNDKIAAVAWRLLQDTLDELPGTTKAVEAKAKKLLAAAQETVQKETPPAFYRNKHCPECQFRESCHKKLLERDCISLLAGMTPKTLAKYHNRGFFTITQLSFAFRPRKRRMAGKIAGTYLWELKALAIREKKTYVLRSPELAEQQDAIYIDFEGLPDEDYIYLIGVLVKSKGGEKQSYAFWADNKAQEKEGFDALLNLLNQYPDVPVYHYGSYEVKNIKRIAKLWGDDFGQALTEISKRLVNLLGYLRTNVYPPIYSNGLKEIGKFLGYEWTEGNADGLQSIEWRKKWEQKHEECWKEKLTQYNLDDCKALELMHHWLCQLTSGSSVEPVQQVGEMKRPSPYKFHNNPEYGEDFQHISKAAYFDYQRNKIYWRTAKAPVKAKALTKKPIKTRLGRGVVTWKPKKTNEVVYAVPLKKCPYCGCAKLYQIASPIQKYKQTDLKFTSAGAKQWVTEYRSTSGKCAECWKHFNNGLVRRPHYGDNIMAWAINLYVNYNISNALISRLLYEQFGIWANPLYFVSKKGRWWDRWKEEINYIKKIVLQSPVIHIDETSVKLAKDKGYVWTFATTHTVYYHLTLNREADFLHEWLKDYKGIIVTDFFPAYEALSIKRQKCLVHLIRDLNDDLFKNPFDNEFRLVVVAFGKLLRRITETIDRFGLKKNHLQKHLKDTQEFYSQFLDKAANSELSIKYSKRLKKHWEELWTFLNYDGIPWNNNNAEAALKAFALYRRGVNGQVGEKGMREYLEMLSLAQTCRFRDISFLDFLRHKAGIWQNADGNALPPYLPFAQARLFTRQLEIKSRKDWFLWCESAKHPAFLPIDPFAEYKNKGWVSWPDWLGY